MDNGITVLNQNNKKKRGKRIDSHIYWTHEIYLFILNPDFNTHSNKKQIAWFGNQVALQLDQLHIILIITKIYCTHTHVSINSTFCRCVFVVVVIVVPSFFETVVVSEQIFVICIYLIFCFTFFLHCYFWLVFSWIDDFFFKFFLRTIGKR